MINFFRKIRQRLLTENKVSKYMFYALGEIVLVVIGILIALQINNWNELKKERLKEYQILMALQKDFRVNKANLDRTTIWLPQLMDTLAKGLTYIGKDALQSSEQMQNTITYTSYSLTDVVDGSLTSVLSSEKLELISNDSLKYRLTAYPSIVKKFQKQEALLENYVLEKQRPILRKYITLLDIIDIPSEYKPGFAQLKKEVVKSDYKGLLNDREYQNAIAGILIQNSLLLQYANEIIKETELIIMLLDDTLQNNPYYDSN
ncbi:MAG: DUF6090 family protein [Maribacter sp.]|nr:DUF6090 family protein [Maribacter sp.]